MRNVFTEHESHFTYTVEHILWSCFAVGVVEKCKSHVGRNVSRKLLKHFFFLILPNVAHSADLHTHETIIISK